MAISVGSAVGSGFNLIGQRPWLVIGWGFLYVIAVVVIELLAFALFGVAPMTPTALTPAEALQQVAPQMGRALFVLVLELPLAAVTVGAVMRAMLEPEHLGFAYLRFGRQEV